MNINGNLWNDFEENYHRFYLVLLKVHILNINNLTCVYKIMHFLSPVFAFLLKLDDK